MKCRILFFALSFFVFSCSDIFEHDLSNDVVQINSPGNNSISQTYSQIFWWGELDNALTYNMQIAKPSFDSSGSLLFDTTTSATKISYSLTPGTYQWRVRAQNGSSKTNYTTYNLRIDTGSFSSQTVNLTSPADLYLTNQRNQQLQWQGVFGAVKYKIVIDSGNIGNVFLDTIITSSAFNPSFSYSFSKDKSYYWQVTAGNGSTYSNLSPFRRFDLDRVGPDSVSMPISTPSTSPIHLLWSGPGDANSYRLFIYTNGTTAYAGFPKDITSASYNFTGGTSGTKLYWTVQAIDKAGNVGLPAKQRSFIVP